MGEHVTVSGYKRETFTVEMSRRAAAALLAVLPPAAGDDDVRRIREDLALLLSQSTAM